VNGQSAVDRHGLDDVADRVRQVAVIEVAPPATAAADDGSPLTTPNVQVMSVVVSFRNRRRRHRRRWAQSIIIL